MDRFRSLLLKALGAVEKALDKRDARTAIELLKMAGLDMTKDGNTLGMYLVGEDDPESILEKVAMRKKEDALFEVFPPPNDREKKNVLDELEELTKKLERLQAGTGA